MFMWSTKTAAEPLKLRTAEMTVGPL